MNRLYAYVKQIQQADYMRRNSLLIKVQIQNTLDSLYLDYSLSQTSLYFEQKGQALGHLCTL